MLSVSEASGNNRDEYAIEKNPHREVRFLLTKLQATVIFHFDEPRQRNLRRTPDRSHPTSTGDKTIYGNVNASSC